MKMMGRKHRPYFRICAVDSRNPRDGRVLEELGTYDRMVSDTDARASWNSERINSWPGAGARRSVTRRTRIKKYAEGGTHAAAQAKARERLAMPRVVPDPGEPVYVPAAEEPAAAVATAPAEASAGVEAKAPAEES